MSAHLESVDGYTLRAWYIERGVIVPGDGTPTPAKEHERACLHLDEVGRREAARAIANPRALMNIEYENRRRRDE